MLKLKKEKNNSNLSGACNIIKTALVKKFLNLFYNFIFINRCIKHTRWLYYARLYVKNRKLIITNLFTIMYILDIVGQILMKQNNYPFENIFINNANFLRLQCDSRRFNNV